MAHTTSIYYPWIEIRDPAWLRTACLYWDVVQTIVPKSIASPYDDNEDLRRLADEGVLQPYFVAPDSSVVKRAAEDFTRYLETDEAQSILLGTARLSRIHKEKMPPILHDLTNIHPDKLAYGVQKLFNSGGLINRKNDPWLRMNSSIADYYMTLLATQISNEIGAAAVTDDNRADGLSLLAKAGAKVPNPVLFRPDARRRRYQSKANIDAPTELVEGALATLALDGIGIRDDVAISKLLEFRRDYADELNHLRRSIADLAGQVDTKLPLTAMRQKVWDIYSTELQPALSGVQKALKGRRVGFVTEAILKTSFISAGPTSLLVVAGLAVPQALLAGAGISLIASGILYQLERKKVIESNPYSFLLRAREKFGT